jgi:hypothetical protein
MVLNRFLKSGKDAYLLVPIIALALFIAFIPNISYPYPVHIDEWVHMAHGETLMQVGDINYPDPFYGEEGASVVRMLEAGFHIFTGVFQSISGISWVNLAMYLPSVIFAFTILSVFMLTRRMGFGWEAAFFTCLIPTTVGIMGPAFFIPLALSLCFIPLVLFLVFNYRTIWSYLVLLVFVVFIIITHATSAICLVLILIPCILIYLVKEPKHGLILLLMGVVPFLVTLPWTYRLIVSTAETLFVAKPLPAGHDLPMLLRTYGYVPFGVGLLGVFWLSLKGGVKNYSLVLGLVVMAAMVAIFYTLHYGVDLVYLRGILYMLLILGMVAGAGLMAIKNLKLPERLGLPDYLRKVGYVLALVLVVVILVIAIPARQNAKYYHIIDDDDYETFVWIKKNVDDSYSKALLDPWKATPFAAITGRYVYTRIHMGPDEITAGASKFLTEGCRDTGFLKENGVSLIYTRQEVDNPDLVPVHEWVYLLPE